MTGVQTCALPIFAMLISCPKEIADPNKKPRFSSKRNAYRELKFTLHSVEQNEIVYFAYVNQSLQSPENFSIVLMLQLPSQNYTLFRCNGKHNEPKATNIWHAQYHTHTLSVDDIQHGRTSDPDFKSLASYRSIPSAIDYFITTCNIMGLKEQLPNELKADNLLTRQITMDEM